MDYANGVREVFYPEEYADDYPESAVTRCGHCYRSWDDAHASSLTPAPSGRCPFEYAH